MQRKSIGRRGDGNERNYRRLLRSVRDACDCGLQIKIRRGDSKSYPRNQQQCDELGPAIHRNPNHIIVQTAPRLSKSGNLLTGTCFVLKRIMQPTRPILLPAHHPSGSRHRRQFRSGSHEEQFQNVGCDEEDSDRLRIDLAQALENLESVALPVNVEIRRSTSKSCAWMIFLASRTLAATATSIAYSLQLMEALETRVASCESYP